MTYDEAIQKIEQIVTELEQSAAISVTDYKTKASEAKRLLDFCESQLTDMQHILLSDTHPA